MTNFFYYTWLTICSLVVLISSSFFYIGMRPDFKEFFESFYINFFQRVIIFSIPGLLLIILWGFINYAYLQKELEYIKKKSLFGLLIILLSSLSGTTIFSLS